MIWRFGDFEFDPASYRLSREGRPLRLEPRVSELLAYLIEQRLRVVPKEELFAAVWRGQAVSDAVLTRAIYELRRALGDNPQEPAFLKTVHGRGYQFVGAITAPPEASEVPTSPAALTTHEPGTSRPDARPGRTRVAIAFAAVLLIALVAATVRFAGSARSGKGAGTGTATAAAAPPAGVMGRLALLPFAVEERDSAHGLVALSVVDLLWARLSELDGLIVRAPDYSAGAHAGAVDFAERAREAGVDFLLTGTLTSAREPHRVRIAVELQDASDLAALRSIPIGRYDLPTLTAGTDLAEFTRVREAIAANVASHLGPALALPDAFGAPRNAEAYRAYLLARQRILELTCGGTDAVTGLLERSLALDPEFALAWTLMGYAHYSQVWACGREERFALDGLVATERALAIQPDLAAATLLKITLLTDLGRTEDAYAWAREAHGRRPRDPSILYGQSYVLRYAGQLERAEATLRRALRLDPLLLEQIGETPMPLLYLGRYDEYLALLPTAETPYYRFYRGLAETLRGHPEEAREVLRPAFRLNPNDLFARLSAGLLAILENDPRGGAEIVRQVARQRRELGSPDGEMTFKEAQLLALAGESEPALEQLARAVDQGFGCVACIEGDPLLAPLADRARFREILERAAVRHRAFAARFSFSGPMRPHPEPG